MTLLLLIGLASFFTQGAVLSSMFSPSEIDLGNANFQAPLSMAADGRIHWLGTDQIGRDILAGLIKGCEISLFIAFISVSISILIGLPFGIWAGWYKGSGISVHWSQIVLGFLLKVLIIYLLCYASFFQFWKLLFLLGTATILLFGLQYLPFRKTWTWDVDSNMMRMVEIFMGLPGLLILIAVSAMIDNKSVLITGLVIGILRWPTMSVIARNETVRVKKEAFVHSAQALGIEPGRMFFKHILPNILTPIMVTAILAMASTILIESALSFLGLGVALETQTWGSMLAEARKQISAWWVAVLPGAAIFFTVLALHQLGRKSS